jgi:hypothetical protein
MNHVKAFKAALFAGTALVATSTSAAAFETLTFTGDTTGLPTWTRPSSTTTVSGTVVPFETFTLPSGSTPLSLEVTVGSFDTILALYTNPFDDTSPLTNIVAYDDDDGAGLLSLITGPFPAADYTGVVIGFGAGSFWLCTNCRWSLRQ